jgi:uncharacterized protein (DUF427 family)
MKVIAEPAGPGQESVWCYPRPPVAQPCASHLKVMHRGVTAAETRRAIRTLETSHPPTYYFPREDVAMYLLRRSQRRSFCEWKGEAVYFDVLIEGRPLCDVAWSYPRPSAGFESLGNHIAFYARSFEGCFIDGERATPQPGGFYGGWITSHVAGPFKGGPGSQLW